DIHYYDSIEDFFGQNPGNYYMLSKFGKKFHSEMDYSNTGEDHYFVFGRETSGLPDWVKDKYNESWLRVPMTSDVRSLNLSNTAKLLVYEALRQQGYPELIYEELYNMDQYAVIDLLKTRRSIRKFTEEKLSGETIKMLVEAAQSASASSYVQA